MTSTPRIVVVKDQKEYYTRCLKIVNGLLGGNLTPRQIELLVILYVTYKNESRYAFSGQRRVDVRENLGIADKTLAGHLWSLRKASWMVKDDFHPTIKEIMEKLDSENNLHVQLVYNVD